MSEHSRRQDAPVRTRLLSPLGVIVALIAVVTLMVGLGSAPALGDELEPAVPDTVQEAPAAATTESPAQTPSTVAPAPPAAGEPTVAPVKPATVAPTSTPKATTQPRAANNHLRWEVRDGAGALIPGATFKVERHSGGSWTGATTVTDNGQGDLDPAEGRIQVTATVDSRYRVQMTAAPEGFGFNDKDWRETPSGTAFNNGTTHDFGVFSVSTAVAAMARAAVGDLTPTRPNPALPQRCGTDAAIILDFSNSVGDAGIAQSKEAAKAVIDAVATSGTGVGIYTFATNAPAVAGQNREWLPLGTTAQIQAAKNYVDTLLKPSNATGGTNWDGGLKRVNEANRTYDFVYFVTDGVPTANDNTGSSAADQDKGSRTHFSDIDNAIQRANALKAKGSYLIPVAVGMGNENHNVYANNSDRNVEFQMTARAMLQRIDRDYVSASNYNELVATLNSVLAPCQSSVIVEKQIVDVDGRVIANTAPDYIAEGWEFTVSGLAAGFSFKEGSGSDRDIRTDRDGHTPQLDMKTATPSSAGTLTIEETEQEGYRIFQQDGQNAVCRIGEGVEFETATGWKNIDSENKGENGLKVAVEAGKITHCVIQNQEQVAAAVEKGPRPGDEVEVDSESHADLEYTITVSNAEGGSTGNLAVETGEILESVLLPATVVAREDITIEITHDGGVIVSDARTTIPAAEFVNGAEIPLASNVRLPADTSATFTITVPVRVEATTSEEWAEIGTCRAGDGGSYSGGVQNRVLMGDDSDGPENNTACIPVLKQPETAVKIIKENHEGVELPGARFALHGAELNSAGEPVRPGELIQELETTSDTSFVSRDLPAGHYYLVELQSPEGYSLLPKPIGFSLDLNRDKEFSIILVADSDLNHVVSIDQDAMSIRVADTRTGDLPKSGSTGVGPYAVISALLLVLGVAAGRRLGRN